VSAILERFDAARALADLRELTAATGDERGARRLAWSDGWQQAREWVRARLAELPCTLERDEAGSLWATLPGARPEAVVVGSHVDAVPAGGWLDGTLGVVAGLEVMRAAAAAGQPPVTLRLVDWADEEGARFGPSLFGSRAVVGDIDPPAMADLRDADGLRCEDVLRANGVELARVLDAGRRRGDIDAYLELHVEQGPLLEQRGLSCASVDDVLGIDRHSVRFTGAARHAGQTPMEVRRDAFLAGARFALECREIARRRPGALATTGPVTVDPGIVTVVNGGCAIMLDLRSRDRAELAEMVAEARSAAARIAEQERVELDWEVVWEAPPMSFDPELVAIGADACAAETGERLLMASGSGHDAVALGRHLPAALLFVRSTGGIGHSPEEDSPEADLLAGLRAFARLVDGTIAWLERR